MGKFTKIARIAEIEFSDIVLSTQDLGTKLRIYCIDKSFIDIHSTENLPTPRFSLHFERNHIDGTIYRVDNTPDKKWKSVSTFPTHFHNKQYYTVVEPPFLISSSNIEKILRNFLKFFQNIILDSTS